MTKNATKPLPTTDEYVEACIPETGLQIILWDAQAGLKTTEKQLRSDAEYMIRRMQSLLARLDEGNSVNSLGEIQGSALDIDRLCALRQERVEQITRLEWAIARDSEKATGQDES